jgi:ankyrin repeat protein
MEMERHSISCKNDGSLWVDSKCSFTLGTSPSFSLFLPLFLDADVHYVTITQIAREAGQTALHCAASRGDVEVVEILLTSGANPSLKNDLGEDAASVCSAFPELRGLLSKRARKMKLTTTSKKTKFVEALGKRISTATPIRYDMWLISLETMLMLYGSEGKGRVMEVHQKLKTRSFLTRWQDVPSDSEIIFVSHEWLSWAHPDPEGTQLRVLCRVLERLKEGELDTEMDPFHTLIFKHKFTTKGKDWEAMLKRTYLWVDWFSMPQPGAEKEDEIGKEAMETLIAEGSRAIRSIPAYVERSDFIMILVPGCHHSDRKVPTCYRTWRRRGWCLLELYAAVMARDSSNPPLLVRSERGTPSWMSPLEVMKLSIGLADFTCCQRNHVITTETQKITSGGKVKKIPCDKPIAGGILEQLINAKINHLYNAEGDLVMARLHYVFKHLWMRGLKEKKTFVTDKNKSAVEKFKKKLRWKDDEKWFDCGGVGVLVYAVVSDEPHVVRELLQELKQKFKGDEYTRRLKSRIRDEGYIALGIPGGTTTLMAAMMTASHDIVSVLLECGANIESVDVMGNDAFMYASTYGRPKNLQCWLQTVKDWDLNRQNTVLGGCALGLALYMGSNKLETVKVLLNAGARLDYRTFGGGTVLTAAVENEDSDPDIIRLILEKLKSLSDSKSFISVVNYQRKPATLKWKSIYFIAKVLYRTGVSESGLMASLAIVTGTTPLNLAVVRGDVEIVKLLLENDADPYVENDLGMNAFDICEKCGPFPSVRRVLIKHTQGDPLALWTHTHRLYG